MIVHVHVYCSLIPIISGYFQSKESLCCPLTTACTYVHTVIHGVHVCYVNFVFGLYNTYVLFERGWASVVVECQTLIHCTITDK